MNNYIEGEGGVVYVESGSGSNVDGNAMAQGVDGSSDATSDGSVDSGMPTDSGSDGQMIDASDAGDDDGSGGMCQYTFDNGRVFFALLPDGGLPPVPEGGAPP